MYYKIINIIKSDGYHRQVQVLKIEAVEKEIKFSPAISLAFTERGVSILLVF
jgi:hypothetical protein